jgi:LysM repeat protein
MQSGSEPDPEAVQESFPVFEPYLGEQSEEGKAAPEPETSEDIPSEEPPAVESDPLPAETTAQTPPPHQSNDDEASPASPVLDAAALPDTPPRPSSIDPQVGGSETVIPEHRVPGFGLYIVRKNDTVPSVAERHSLSVDALVDLNRHLESGSRLVPGEVLRVAPGNLLLLPEDAPVPADTGTTASVES